MLDHFKSFVSTYTNNCAYNHQSTATATSTATSGTSTLHHIYHEHGYSNNDLNVDLHHHRNSSRINLHRQPLGSPRTRRGMRPPRNRELLLHNGQMLLPGSRDQIQRRVRPVLSRAGAKHGRLAGLHQGEWRQQGCVLWGPVECYRDGEFE